MTEHCLAARKIATYDDLYNIPENETGEIIDGELIASPRPSRRHGYTMSSVGGKIITPYMDGGSFGGWVIIIEAEIAFNENILVPDLAGWKKERFLAEEEHNWISVVPDWVCEIISPNSAGIDRVKKMGIYAHHRVPYYWIIDPLNRILEVFKNENGRWVVWGTYAEEDKVRAEPFQEIEISLCSLWLENALK